MKTYVLLISRHFPATHPRKGESTFFPAKILNALGGDCWVSQPEKKRHTIRANYELWAKRAEEINAGKAMLSIRYWSDKPYRSKQVEFCVLNRIGVQKLQWVTTETVSVWPSIYEVCWREMPVNIPRLAENDGLSYEDFKAWFKDYDISKPMAIIHFTDFRY